MPTNCARWRGHGPIKKSRRCRGVKEADIRVYPTSMPGNLAPDSLSIFQVAAGLTLRGRTYARLACARLHVKLTHNVCTIIARKRFVEFTTFIYQSDQLVNA